MARVPQYERQVRSTPIANVRRQAAETPDSLGAGVGQAIADTGATLARAGVRGFLEVQEREREKANQIAHVSAMKQLTDWQLKRLHGPEGAWATRKGKNAQGLPEELEQEFTQIADEIEAGLATEDQRNRFQQAREGVRENVLLNAHKHAERELAEFDKQEFAGFVTNQKNLVAAQADDAVAVNQAIEQASNRTREFASRQGMAPEAAEAQVAATRNEMWSSAINTAIAQGDADLARRYFEDARDAKQLTGEALTKMTDVVKRGAADVEGEKAAAEIWAEKVTGDDVNIKELSDAARARFSGNPEALRATLSALDRRKAEVEDVKRKTDDKLQSTLWGAVAKGATYDQVRRLPGFFDDGKIAQAITKYFDDERERAEYKAERAESRAASRDARADAAEARAERKRERDGWARMNQIRADLTKLRAMGEGEIYALLPELGHAHVDRLLREREGLLKDDASLSKATYDRELFLEVAGESLPALNKKPGQRTTNDNANIEKLESLARQEIGARQLAARRELTREEKREAIKTLVDSKVLIKRDFWFDETQIAGLVKNEDDHARAYVPLADVPGSVTTDYVRYLKSEYPREFANVPDDEVRTRLGSRIERAYALKRLGYPDAAIQAALKGK